MGTICCWTMTGTKKISLALLPHQPCVYVLSDHLLLAPSPMTSGPVDPSNSQVVQNRETTMNHHSIRMPSTPVEGNFFDGQPGEYLMQPHHLFEFGRK